jgi:predicted RNA-binding protein
MLSACGPPRSSPAWKVHRIDYERDSEMTGTYWLNLFSGETWEVFLKHGAGVTGFRASQKKVAEKVKPGDRFLCYITGISRFIAVLEAKGPQFWDETPVWKGESYPVRFKVEPLAMVPFENAIPVIEIRDHLKIFEGASENTSFGYLFQGSLRKFPSEDGELILKELRREKEFPTPRPVDPKKLYRPTSHSRLVRAKAEKGEVTVPEREEPPALPTQPSEVQAEATAHTEIQWLLLKLGSEMGLRVWVARNDKSKEYQGRRFADLPRVIKELPHQFIEAVQNTIERIDVLWLKQDTIVGAFEIESTTSIYSGLLRMSDLISMQPNLTIPLYIVAPDERRGKVIEEINRPTFANLRRPMSQMCRFVSFSDLKEAVQKHQGLVRYLPPEWMWEEVAESCELDPVS